MSNESLEESGITIIEDKETIKNCQVCGIKEWIYTCPRCLIHTCCLACVQQHKQETDCSGERDKTAYVALKKYTESHMMSDYTYLEDVARQSDNITRGRHTTDKELKTKAAENRSKVFSKIVNQMGIRYSCLPFGMSRNKLNQSNYSKSLKQVFWSIEVNFIKDNKRKRYLEHSFPSNKTLHGFFENLLLSAEPQGKGNYNLIRYELSEFISTGINNFVIALKKEKSQRGHFINMTPYLDTVFKDVLKDEVIIEYPIFYIWSKDDQQPSDVSLFEEKKQLITVMDSCEISPSV